jgi:acetylornithine deacetylase
VTAFDLVHFHERAVSTASDESVDRMRELLCETLEDAGVTTRVDDAGNVVATRGPTAESGDGERPHLLLNTHLDTVPPHVGYSRDGDVVRGRGACDAKGPLAALVAAFLAHEPTTGRVSLAVTPDEERYSTGAAALVDGGLTLGGRPVDGVVVGEPTDLDVCTAAKGRFEGTVTLSGTAAHAAEPASGASAVAALEPVLAAIGRFDDERGPGRHDSLGAPTLTPTTVEGGVATNQVPAECRLVLDRRSVPPETASGFGTALTEHLRAAVPEGVGVSFEPTDRPTPFLAAFATDPTEPLVTALAAAARAAGEGKATDGSEAGGQVRPFGAATEASYFAEHAPTVVFGPGVLADGEGAVAHAEREYVRVSAVERAADAVGRLLAELT